MAAYLGWWGRSSGDASSAAAAGAAPGGGGGGAGGAAAGATVPVPGRSGSDVSAFLPPAAFATALPPQHDAAGSGGDSGSAAAGGSGGGGAGGSSAAAGAVQDGEGAGVAAAVVAGVSAVGAAALAAWNGGGGGGEGAEGAPAAAAGGGGGADAAAGGDGAATAGAVVRGRRLLPVRAVFGRRFGGATGVGSVLGGDETASSSDFDDDDDDDHDDDDGDHAVGGTVAVGAAERTSSVHPPADPEAVRLARFGGALLWFTYRMGFAPIGGEGQSFATAYTTDAGWGCTLRAAQLLAGNALLAGALGDDGGSTPSPAEVMGVDPRARDGALDALLPRFADEPEAPLSIHALSLRSALLSEGRVGDWFGPATAARALQQLLDADDRPAQQAAAYVAPDATLFQEDFFAAAAACRGGNDDDDADDDDDGKGGASAAPAAPTLLVLIPVRLGLASLNVKAYAAQLRDMFAIPQCAGIIGGRPRSAVWLFASLGQDRLMYLDPHTCQPAWKNGQEGVEDDARGKEPALPPPSFRPPAVYDLAIADLDPSMTLGFVCRADRAAALWNSLQDFAARHPDAPLWSMQGGSHQGSSPGAGAAGASASASASASAAAAGGGGGAGASESVLEDFDMDDF